MYFQSFLFFFFCETQLGVPRLPPCRGRRRFDHRDHAVELRLRQRDGVRPADAHLQPRGREFPYSHKK